MVRIGVIGDTQGRYRVHALLDFVAARFGGVDEIWHAGDWQEEAVLDGLRALGKPFEVVNGNAPDDPRFPMTVERTIEGLEVGMVHRPPPGDDPWAARLDLCIHGHTHRWRNEVVGRTRFVNVGTATSGGAGGAERTMGVVTLDAGTVRVRRIRVAL